MRPIINIVDQLRSLMLQNADTTATYLLLRLVARWVITPNEIDMTVVCAAGHFAPARFATKRKLVQTLAQCPPPVLIKQ